MSAPAYSIRAVLLIDGEWRNTEVGTATKRRFALEFAEAYANREGRACYVHKLQPPVTVGAGGNRAMPLPHEVKP